MGRAERDAKKNAAHDARMANWHAGLGRHGEDGAPQPVPGADTTHANERTYTRDEAAGLNKRDIVSMHTKGGKVVVVFKRGKAPPH